VSIGSFGCIVSIAVFINYQKLSYIKKYIFISQSNKSEGQVQHDLFGSVFHNVKNHAILSRVLKVD
jgi:hypothetical protein